MSKPTLCVDFDGTVHAYTSGWQGVGTVADEPVPGAIEWLRAALEHFDVAIYSSRSKDPKGVEAMRLWLTMWAFDLYGHGDIDWLDELSFPTEKPTAFLTIDDRAICFDGDFSALDPEKLLQFQPWNRGGESDRQRAQRAEAALRGARAELVRLQMETWESITVEDESGIRVVADGEDGSEVERFSRLIDQCDAALPADTLKSEPDACGLCGCSLVGARFYPVAFFGLQVAVCPDCAEREGESVDAHPTPEQSEGEKLDADMQAVLDGNRRRHYLSGESEQTEPRRDFVAGDDGYFTFSWPQKTGDALALFEWYVRKCWFMTSIERKDLEDRIRQALTASGVPEGWKWRIERDVTDEYITSLIAPDGTTVYVGEDDKAIAWLERLLSANSGVPEHNGEESFEALHRLHERALEAVIKDGHGAIANVAYDYSAVHRRMVASGVPPLSDDEALEGFQAASGLYNSLMVWLSGDDPQAVSSRESATQMYSTLRQALRASGVPYVPEEVRKLPDRMDCQADARDDGDFISDHQRGVVDATRHWAKSLRQALASAPAVDRVPDDKYTPFLGPFVRLMNAELHANAGKGDRQGWLSMSSDQAMLEIYYHAAKLQKAVRDGDGALIREHSADVANMSMMLLDLCVGLPDQEGVIAAAPQRGGE